jgi:hypothetical protein
MDKIEFRGDGMNYAGGDDVLIAVQNKSLSIRNALSRGFFHVYSDRTIFDTEYFSQLFEKYMKYFSDIAILKLLAEG